MWRDLTGSPEPTLTPSVRRRACKPSGEQVTVLPKDFEKGYKNNIKKDESEHEFYK